MKKEDLRHVLNWDACIQCGDCLVECRYVDYSRQKAIEEIGKINNGLPSDIVKDCISCYACNAFCGHNAHPYERIHYEWNEKYEKSGLPVRAKYLMPGSRPNFREDLPYSAEEKALHEKWNSELPPAKVVLYPGCNLLSMPLLATGKIFDNLPVWGNWDLCCGEMYFRTGLLDPTKKTAEKLTAFYEDKDIDEMVFICPAGYNMFTNILPQQFGAHFNFKTRFFTDWLTDALDQGMFEIKRKLDKSVVIHDSCHARVLGPNFMDDQRRLLKKLGMTIKETDLNKEKGLCCGMAAGANKFSITDLTRCAMQELSALDSADGDEIAIYCSGCLLMLSTARPFNPFGKKLVHFLEYIRYALGEEVPRRNMRRAVSIMKGVALHSLPHYFSKKHFQYD